MLNKMINSSVSNLSPLKLSDKIAQAKAYYLSLLEPARLFFKGQADVPIHYVVDLCEKEEAALIIVPGWAETGMRYAELMLDLKPYNLSYYVLDHRDMGFSGRLLPDRQKTHIDSFQYYIDDLKKFINSIVCARPHKKLYILAHSLGGLITARYLEQEPTKVDGAILASPLLEISSRLLPEKLILAISKTNILLSKATEYAPGQGPATKHSFTEANTHSKERWQFFEDIQSSFPEIKKGGMTNHWLSEVIQNIVLVRKNALQIKTPTLVLQASEDQMAPASGQDVFCKTGNIQKISFPKAKHELLMEEDHIRNEVLSSILQFFKLQ